jgi:hypothetical protein
MGTRKKSPRPGGRLGRLLVCLVLFLAVFWGRGTDWAPAAQITQRLSTILSQDMGVQETFARVGESFSQGAPAVETFRALVTRWDGTQEETVSPDQPQADGQTQKEDSDGET